MKSFHEFIREFFDPTAKLLKAKSKIKKTDNKIILNLKLLRYAHLNFRIGSSIGYNAKFDEDPYFPHGARSIFISGGAHIGKHSIIFHEVTIGSNTIPTSAGYGCPDIGDNCYIGAGAKVIGKVKIGNNVRIGAGAIVVKDVPDNSIVVAQPVRIISKKNIDNTFYSYKEGELYTH
jgi:serine O-acetyltransferase